MALVKPADLIKSLSRKYCMHSDTYFRTNKHNGKVYTGKLCNPYAGVPTPEQTANRTKFATVAATARAILAAQQSDADPTNYNKLVRYQKEYKSDTTAGSLYGLIFSKEYKLTV